MSEADPALDDTGSLRLAAQLPCTLMVVGVLPALTSQRRELAQEGYNAVWVGTKAQALAQHEQEPCSVMVVASHLPDGTGAELTASVRAQSHSSYVYLIVQADDEANVAPDADDWVALSASCEDLMTHLRAARRIVTMERSCRVANESARLRGLVDRQFGTFSRQLFISEAIRRLAELQRDDRAVALLLVRSGFEEECLEHLTDIANVLLDAGRNFNGVVARLSAVTFGLFMSDVDEHSAAAAHQQIVQRLSQLQSVLSCGVALVGGPITEPHDSFKALNQAAERTLRPITRTPREELGDAVGA